MKAQLVCHCFGIHAVLIEEVVSSNRLSTLEDVTNYTKAGGGCTSCHEKIEEILDQIKNAPGSEARGRPGQGPRPAARAPRFTEMTMAQRVMRVEAVIEKVRPQLRADHGDIELVEIEGKTIYVKMMGACQGCPMEQATLGGIQQKLIEEFGEFLKVLPSSRMPATCSVGGGHTHG